MRRIVVALVAALLMTSLVACGKATDASGNTAPKGTKTDANGNFYTAQNCPTSNAEAFPNTRLVADIGIMYVAFDHYIYQPFKADKFAKTSEKVKAGLAAVAIYHFAKKVKQHVIYSSFLCSKIGTPISDLTDKLASLPTLVKDAVTGGGSIDAIKSGMDNLPGLAKGAGLPGLDLKNIPVPGIDSLAGIS